MPNVSVAYGNDNNTHDISLSDGSTTYGLIYTGNGVIREIPLSPPAQPFAIEQQNWIGGRGRVRYTDDPTGFNDSDFLWSTTEGKLLPSLQWRYGDGIRNHVTLMPGDDQDLAWWKLYGNTPASQIAQYMSSSFSHSAGFTAVRYMFIVRRRGTPGTLTYELCSDDTGDPGSVVQTGTVTTSTITDTVAIPYEFYDPQALSAATTYHLKLYGADTDSATDHWEVLVNDDGSNSKYSVDNSTWAAANVSMYYRIRDSNINRQWFFFELEGATYAVCKYASGTSSKLYINGVRGTASSATSTTLVDSGLSMTTDIFIGAYIRIIDGTGDGQVRQITDNDGTSFTVATWDITPDTTSRFVVYSSPYWTEIGTTGLGVVTGKPTVADKIVYFPQGQSDNIRRMRVNGNSHDFADDSTNKADLMYVHAEGTTPKVYVAHADSSYVKSSDTKAWGTNLALGNQKSIGSSDTRITNMYGHNKTLHIFKYDGLYTYSNNVVEKLGSFSDVPDPTTGLGVSAKDNFLWFGWAHSVERMAGASITDMMNFKLGYDGMGEDKKGYVSFIVSGVGWLFVAINGGASDYSTILCWNGYGWHEVYKTNEAYQIQNMFWQPNIGSRGRLWFDMGGELMYIEYPQYAANPLKDTSINYNYEGVCVTSTMDAREPQLYKLISMIRTYIEQGTVEIDYQTNANVGTSTWTSLVTASTSPVTDTNIDLGGVFQIRFRFRLQSADTRTPCIVTGWQVSGRQMPLGKYQWIASFIADTENETYTDEPDHNPSTVYSQLQTWALQQTKLTMRSTSETMDNKVVTISLPAKTVYSVDGTEWTGEIQFAMLET